MELKHTIKLIEELDNEIDEIESEIKRIMDESNSPILSIPGISYRMGAMIIAETGDFSRFDSPDKILAYAGISPSTYQPGQLESSYSYMEKRGSRYLRYALINAAKYVCFWDPTFEAYLAKKNTLSDALSASSGCSVSELYTVFASIRSVRNVSSSIESFKNGFSPLASSVSPSGGT